jgi:hypothetical protein
MPDLVFAFETRMHPAGFGGPVAQAHMGLKINHGALDAARLQAVEVLLRVELRKEFLIPIVYVHVH